MSDSGSSDEDYYGPSLPPGFENKSVEFTGASSSKTVVAKAKDAPEQISIGPTLPPELRARLEANATAGGSDSVERDDELSSPTSQEKGSDSGSESDSNVIGPLPPDHPKAQLQAARSSQKSSAPKVLKREEWMLVPPKNKIIPGLGLGPRKFLTRTPQDSRNSDEETDEEEAFAREADAEIERKMIDEYDQKMDDMKKDFETKKRRGESLLDIHRKELKKKKEKSTEKKERKAFDRDMDLKITGLSDGDKQKYIEKSKELNTKFSRGTRKYL